MTAPLYKFFYRQYGIRKISQLLSPRPIRLLSLPRNSLFHYFNDEVNNYPIDINLSFLTMFRGKAIVDFTSKYVDETYGSFRKKPFLVRNETRDFFKEHKNYRYVPDGYRTINNEIILFIQNHSYLNAIYKYVEMPMTIYNEWHNTYSTIFHNVNEIAKNSNKNQFIILDIPDEIPSFSVFEMYKNRESIQLLKLFNTKEKYLLLELWKWLDVEYRSKSIFNAVDPSKYNLVNFIVRYKDVDVLLNLGYLNSFIKGQTNSTEFNTIVQYADTVVKKLLLRFAINVKKTHTEQSEIIETEVPLQNKETSNADEVSDTDDEITENDNNNLLNNYKQQNNDIAVPQTKVAENDDTDTDDINNQLKGIDEELDTYDKFYKVKLLNKGYRLDTKGNIEEVNLFTETEKPTKEQVLKEINNPLNYSEQLNETIEILAKEDAVTVSEYKKYKKLINDYNESNNVYNDKKIKDTIGYTAEDIVINKNRSTVSVPNTVIDKNMANISTNSLSKDYIENLYHKDIVNMIYSVQKAGVIIKSHTMEVEHSVLGEYEYHRLELVPIDGMPSTIFFKLPKVEMDSTISIGGNKCLIRNQRVDLPIRKIAPNKVSLVSYYGKNFVELGRLKANSSIDFLYRQIFKKYQMKEITGLAPGDSYDNYFVAPYIYNAISHKYKSFVKDDMTFVFDRESITAKISAELLSKVEINGIRVCGYIGNNQLILVDNDNEFYRYENNQMHNLGSIYDVLEINNHKVPVDFGEFRVFDKQIPVGVILGYLLGIDKLLIAIDAKYRVIEKRTDATGDEYVIKFKDVMYAFDKKDTVASKIMGGFLQFEKSIKELNFNDLNNKDSYFSLFQEKGITSVYVKEIELTNQLFIDPITESILKQMKEPTSFIGLLIRSIELLDNYNYPDSQDLTQMRIRGYERISGFIYKELAKSIKTFKNKNISGRSKIDLGPYDVWNDIISDNSLKLVEDINPLQDIKERDVVTYVGEGGRNKDAIQKEARSFHLSDYGVISEATVDSSDVAVNTYMTANPNFKDLRGRTKDTVDSNTVNVMSMSANLAPFSVNDDGKRVNFINIMNSHVISAIGYEAPVVRTGYEYITSKRNTQMFAYAAEADGTVTGLTKKGIIVEYTDGKKLGLEIGRIYGRAEGSYYPHTIVTDLKVGDKFIKDDILVYNNEFYQRDIYDPKSIVLKNVVYGKVVVMENNNTFEDSSAISKDFSTKLVSKTTKVKSIIVNFKQNIHNIVKVGDKVHATSKLMTIEDEISSGYSFDQKALDILQDLAQQAPSAEYSGVVENIEVYYHGDIGDMTSSLKELTTASDNRLSYVRRSSFKPVITGKVNNEYRVEGKPLELDTLEIKIFITVDNPMGVGDKGIFGNQLKSVIGEVMNYEMTTENGDKIDAVFGFRSIFARIVLSPMLMGTTATLMRVLGKRAVKLYRSDK